MSTDTVGLVERLRSAARSASKASWILADSKSARNQSAGDEGSHYQGMSPEQTLEWEAASEIERLTQERDEGRKVCDSYAAENQRLFDRAEAKLAQMREVLEEAQDKFAAEYGPADGDTTVSSYWSDHDALGICRKIAAALQPAAPVDRASPGPSNGEQG